jgi:hypothetical protein
MYNVTRLRFTGIRRPRDEDNPYLRLFSATVLALHAPPSFVLVLHTPLSVVLDASVTIVVLPDGKVLDASVIIVVLPDNKDSQLLSGAPKSKPNE